MIIVGIVGKFASSPLIPVATFADWPNVPVHKCTSAPRAVMYSDLLSARSTFLRIPNNFVASAPPAPVPLTSSVGFPLTL